MSLVLLLLSPNPFKDYKVSKLRQETIKRSIAKEEIISVITYPCDEKRIYERLSVDLFTFFYLMAGINFVDIAYLTNENIVDNRLIYTRRKTHKLIKIPLQPKH